MLISPHQTLFFVILSLTINLSLGDLPVNSPVFTANAPESDSFPNPFSIHIFCNSSLDNPYLISVSLIPRLLKNWLILEFIDINVVEFYFGILLRVSP